MYKWNSAELMDSGGIRRVGHVPGEVDSDERKTLEAKIEKEG
jgi:hypothetical protein